MDFPPSFKLDGLNIKHDAQKILDKRKFHVNFGGWKFHISHLHVSCDTGIRLKQNFHRITQSTLQHDIMDVIEIILLQDCVFLKDWGNRGPQE